MDYADLLQEGMLKVVECTFVSMLFPCKLVYEIGLPLGDLYNWGVDSEFAVRLSQRYDCYSVNKSNVIHKRVIQKALSFANEKDPIRLSYFRSQLRNSIYHSFKYNCHNNRDKLKFLLSYVWLIVRSLSRLNFRETWVRISALKDAVVFRPIIVFPR